MDEATHFSLLRLIEILAAIGEYGRSFMIMRALTGVHGESQAFGTEELSYLGADGK